MTPDDIEKLATKLQALGIAECEVDRDSGASVRLRLGSLRGTQSREVREVREPATDAASAVIDALRSPGMGRFAASHPLRDTRASTPGQSVAVGQVVGYLLAGSVISEITAVRAGRLGQLLVEDGEIVGFGDPVYELC